MRSCACLEGNDGFCPIHGSITRDPDELLHDARMMEAEMKTFDDNTPLNGAETLRRNREQGLVSDEGTPVTGSTALACEIASLSAENAALLAEVDMLKGVLGSWRELLVRGDSILSHLVHRYTLPNEELWAEASDLYVKMRAAYEAAALAKAKEVIDG